MLNKVAYVEDESIFHVLSGIFTNKANFCYHLDCFLTADEFLPQKDEYDLLFIDFYLRIGTSSMDLIDQLSMEAKPPVVIVTSSIIQEGVKQIMHKYPFVFGYIDKSKFNDETLKELTEHIKSGYQHPFFKN